MTGIYPWEEKNPAMNNKLSPGKKNTKHDSKKMMSQMPYIPTDLISAGISFSVSRENQSAAIFVLSIFANYSYLFLTANTSEIYDHGTPY
jgi:hypothetical protein